MTGSFRKPLGNGGLGGAEVGDVGGGRPELLDFATTGGSREKIPCKCVTKSDTWLYTCISPLISLYWVYNLLVLSNLPDKDGIFFLHHSRAVPAEGSSLGLGQRRLSELHLGRFWVSISRQETNTCLLEMRPAQFL